MRRGLILGVTAYFIWGLFPLYWPLLGPASATEILAHRMLWSLVVMVGVLTVARGWSLLRRASRRSWGLVTAGSLVISVNWGLYIYAVNSGQVVEAALGYFINPLVSVLLGVVVFGERLRIWQWVSVALGLSAVVVIGAWSDRFPWVSLALAASFATYGVIKKVVALPPTASLTAEGLILLLPALAYLTFLRTSGGDSLAGNGVGHVVLLALSGVVTVVPLLAFAGAAQALPLTYMGLLQYLTPVVQFLIGVLVVHESMAPARWIGFVFVWLALIVLSADGLSSARRARPATAAGPARHPAGGGSAAPVPSPSRGGSATPVPPVAADGRAGSHTPA